MRSYEMLIFLLGFRTSKLMSHSPERLEPETETLKEEREAEATLKYGRRGRRTSQTMKMMVPIIMKKAIMAARKRRMKVARGEG